MIKVPMSIRKKFKSYADHTQKAEKNRMEIEEWFKKQGINTDVDNGDIDGAVITDIIIDTGMEGNIDGAVELIEKHLNSL